MEFLLRFPSPFMGSSATCPIHFPVPKVGNGEHDDLVLRSGKLSTDSLSETDVGDAAEAITTASTETPVWESLHGV